MHGIAATHVVQPLHTRVAQIWKCQKSTSARPVSHYIGPCDSKMAKIKILNACFGLPQGHQSLCNDASSDKSSASQNIIELVYIFSCDGFSGSKDNKYILRFHFQRNFENIQILKQRLWLCGLGVFWRAITCPYIYQFSNFLVYMIDNYVPFDIWSTFVLTTKKQAIYWMILWRTDFLTAYAIT